jgi:hypothetical protein
LFLTPVSKRVFVAFGLLEVKLHLLNLEGRLYLLTRNDEVISVKEKTSNLVETVRYCRFVMERREVEKSGKVKRS